MKQAHEVELVALPLSGSQFCQHFGRCDGLLLACWHRQSGQVCDVRQVTRRETGCDSLPRWLKALGVQRVVAGGIGAGARQHLAEMGIAVTAGLDGDDPRHVLHCFQTRPDHEGPNPCQNGLEHKHHHCRD